jgi:hypothetical protein
VLLTNILVTPDRAEIIVLACCVLHNMLRTRHPNFTQHLLDQEDEDTHRFIPGSWRSDDTLKSVTVLRGNNTTQAAKSQRQYLCDYLNSPLGSVSWQGDMI